MCAISRVVLIIYRRQEAAGNFKCFLLNGRHYCCFRRLLCRFFYVRDATWDSSNIGGIAFIFLWAIIGYSNFSFTKISESSLVSQYCFKIQKKVFIVILKTLFFYWILGVSFMFLLLIIPLYNISRVNVNDTIIILTAWYFNRITHMDIFFLFYWVFSALQKCFINILNLNDPVSSEYNFIYKYNIIHVQHVNLEIFPI